MKGRAVQCNKLQVQHVGGVLVNCKIYFFCAEERFKEKHICLRLEHDRIDGPHNIKRQNACLFETSLAVDNEAWCS